LVAIWRQKGSQSAVTDNNKPLEQEVEALSRRSLAKKIAYVAPIAFAVIAASERPALAASGGGTETTE
jgi:hypothetical protein